MAKKNNKDTGSNKKMADLEKDAEDSAGRFLTTNQGLKVNDNQNSLQAGERDDPL